MVLSGTKASAELLLSCPPLSWFGRRRMRGRRIILAYHNVVPDDLDPGGDRSLHMRREDFCRQLDHLREIAEVVSLDELLHAQAAPGGADPRVRAAITFDDAYLGAVTLGVEALRERELSATVLTAPGLLGAGPFWWDRLPWGPDPRSNARLRAHALGVLAGRTGPVLHWARTEGMTLHEPVPLCHAATREELLSAAAQPGIAVASHSWSHPSLPSLERTALRAELQKPRAWLERWVPGASPWFSYPYGLSSEAVRDEVARAGYRGGLAVEGGWLGTGGGDVWALPRLNIPAGLSLHGFQARLAGYLAGR